jgi:hypothetical protein
MANKSFVPAKDAQFKNWLSNFVTVASGSPADYGFTPAQITAITALATEFDNVYTARLEAKNNAKVATDAKNKARRDAAENARLLARLVQANPNVTDAQKTALGVTVPKSGKTPVPVPATQPIGRVDDIEEMMHIMRISDSATNKAAKPDGVDGTEIWMKIVDAGAPQPIDPDELAFVGFATGSKVTRSFEAEDVGKTAIYRLRYTNTKGQHGPWGPQFSATIAA